MKARLNAELLLKEGKPTGYEKKISAGRHVNERACSGISPASQFLRKVERIALRSTSG
jgi:hypothetical protein